MIDNSETVYFERHSSASRNFSEGASNYKKLRGLRGIMQGVSQRHWQTCESLASWESLLLCAPCSPPWLLQGE